MNTSMTGLVGFQKSLHSCVLDESSLSIGRVNMAHDLAYNDLLLPSRGECSP